MSAKQMVESLEARRMLSTSAFASVSLSGDTLVVCGTDNLYRPDTITVQENVANAKYVVTVNSGTMKVTKIFNAALVDHIYIDAKKGDDVIKVDASTFQADATIKGGEGNDFMTGGLEQDFFCGDGGEDTVNYGINCGGGSVYDDDAHDAFGKGVWVTLDGNYNDGVQNLGFPSLKENDNVDGGVEDVIGTEYDDVIKGTLYYVDVPILGTICIDNVDNVLEGRGGNDQLYGFGGDDNLDGGCGADQMFGGDGCDTLIAQDGEKDIVVDGGDGEDGGIIDQEDLSITSSVEELVL